MTATERLSELGIELPPPAAPGGLYVPAVRTGDLLYTAGAGPIQPDGTTVKGKVGSDIDLDAAVEAARLTGLQLLAVLNAELGSLDRVTRIVKVLGMVNCAPGFDNTPEVINGCSQLFLDVFGEEVGRGARSAVGLAELPFGMSVEIELIAQVS
jgi:enamine deaminase RidA (YjgF/YER057c/UK114 family)